MLALLILAGTKPAFADCSLSIFKGSPAVPTAQEASYEEMKKAVSIIQHYIRSAEQVLTACAQLSCFSYNYHIGRLKSLADGINQQSVRFSNLAKN
ncbi:hypothetical protein [Litorivivens sp.]|uniref:hypothetical protein n=1 Tax=Litorivivens sp. TaxID=2020868 RepID=UPI003563661D